MQLNLPSRLHGEGDSRSERGRVISDNPTPDFAALRLGSPHTVEERVRLSRYAASLVNCAASVESLKAVVDDAPPEMVMATWSK